MYDERILAPQFGHDARTLDYCIVTLVVSIFLVISNYTEDIDPIFPYESSIDVFDSFVKIERNVRRFIMSAIQNF